MLRARCAGREFGDRHVCRIHGRIAEPGATPDKYARAMAFLVVWHPGAETERDSIVDQREAVAISHAIEKLDALGYRLRFPHCRAVQGSDSGLWELRPRGGKSRWRPIYRRADETTFVVLAVGLEAEVDRPAFDQAVREAATRFADLEF